MVSTKEERFYEKLHQRDLEALWLVIQRLVPRECETTAVPYVWRWADVYPLALEAGEVWPIERGGERRVLILRNPGLGDRNAATNTIYGGIQIVMPGEVAPCHRHWAAAIRFVIVGNGVGYTAVEGEKLVMDDYDLILTPSMDWHDHRNDGETPVIWLDVLDVPLMNLLGISYFEPYEGGMQHPVTKPDWYSERITGDKLVRPLAAGATYRRRRPYIYKWREVRPVLMGLDDADPYDGVAVEYMNPVTGGPTLPTFTCWAQRLRPGEHTRAHRHTASALYHVIEGEGYTVVNGQRLSWQKGDTFAIPHWMWHEHVNASATQDALLFCATDKPALESLGLYFEEPYPRNDGYQQIREEA
jgi:gentisate 1,2-dioxygenase